jgi:F420-non-reducing hydrogenase iron-sulfur subunit
MRLEYPRNVKIVRVPCSGRVSTTHLLHAIEEGADGVYVAGCEEGDCHFMEGNLRAKKRVQHVRDTISAVGLNPDRVRMYNVAASDGPRFVAIAHEVTGRIRELGPTPVKTGGGPEYPSAEDESEVEDKKPKKKK